jgi:hypothetical protein
MDCPFFHAGKLRTAIEQQVKKIDAFSIRNSHDKELKIRITRIRLFVVFLSSIFDSNVTNGTPVS